MVVFPPDSVIALDEPTQLSNDNNAIDDHTKIVALMYKMLDLLRKADERYEAKVVPNVSRYEQANIRQFQICFQRRSLQKGSVVIKS